MIELFHDGGYMMWPILGCALLVLALAGSSARRLLRAEAHERAHSAVAAIPFWGAFALVLGILGTVVGWMRMAGALERAGDVAPALIWGGFGVSLIPTLFGLLVLTVSLLAWLALWLPRRRLAAESRVEVAAGPDSYALLERLEHLEERLRFTESLLESRGRRSGGE